MNCNIVLCNKTKGLIKGFKVHVNNFNFLLIRVICGLFLLIIRGQHNERN